MTLAERIRQEAVAKERKRMEAVLAEERKRAEQVAARERRRAEQVAAQERKRAEALLAEERRTLLQERRALLFDLLEARGLPVSESMRARIEACDSADRLASWLRRSVTASSAEQALQDG